VLSWSTADQLDMHLTYATSSCQCDVSTGVVQTCNTGDVVIEHKCPSGGLQCAESILLSVPRTTVYTLNVAKTTSVSGLSLYDSGAQVDVYIGWGWWGSAWPYAVLPVPGADPFGIDTSHTATYWAVFCARKYSWSGFVPLNRFSNALDYAYSLVGAANKCPNR